MQKPIETISQTVVPVMIEKKFPVNVEKKSESAALKVSSEGPKKFTSKKKEDKDQNVETEADVMIFF